MTIMLNYYCVKCGGYPYPLAYRLASEPIQLSNGHLFYPSVGVSKCCEVGFLWGSDIPIDDESAPPKPGYERFQTENLIPLILLCWKIQKSCRSIRRNRLGFYIDMKAGHHLRAVHGILSPQTAVGAKSLPPGDVLP